MAASCFPQSLQETVHYDQFTPATFLFGGTAVAEWLRCCATNRKVAGSIPAGVIGFFIALWPWGRLSL